MQRQSGLLNERYDLSDRAMQNVMMSGGRKPVQQGVRRFDVNLEGWLYLVDWPRQTGRTHALQGRPCVVDAETGSNE